MKKFTIILISFFIGSGFSNYKEYKNFPAPKPTSEDQKIFQEMGCPMCHGHEGKTPMFPGIPTIGFQDREYLVMALQAFKNGERIINVDRSPLGLDMIKIVALLNDENIERIADYFATRPVWDMSRPVEYPASYVYPRGYESEEDDEQ